MSASSEHADTPGAKARTKRKIVGKVVSWAMKP